MPILINDQIEDDSVLTTESTRLINTSMIRSDNNGYAHHLFFGPATPTTIQSFKNFFFSSYLNWLLLAVPLSFLSHFLQWGPTPVFIISFISLIPLASLLGDSTEQVALKVGSTLGGLINATFGNAVEMIVGIVALTQNQLRIVQTSMLGSILSNILLVLGCSFIGAGSRFKESKFQATAAQASASLMLLACIALVIPAAYYTTTVARLTPGAPPASDPRSLSTLPHDVAQHGLLVISRGTSVLLLAMYFLYLYFQLKSHSFLYADETEHVEDEEPTMNLRAATAALVLVTVVTAFCADYLVDSIDEFATDAGIPKAFIGLILLPIVGNAAEHATAVWMAMKGKMELAIGVAVGSSIQIAVGVIPIMVIVGWITGKPLTLFFENFETICLVFSVLLTTLLIQDGKSNYMEGAMLVSLYVIIALAIWVS